MMRFAEGGGHFREGVPHWQNNKRYGKIINNVVRCAGRGGVTSGPFRPTTELFEKTSRLYINTVNPLSQKRASKTQDSQLSVNMCEHQNIQRPSNPVFAFKTKRMVSHA